MQSPPPGLPAVAPTPKLLDIMALISPGIVLFALIFTSIGVMTDSWSVDEQSTTNEFPFVGNITTTTESKIGLDDAYTSVCINGNCTASEYDLGEQYDNCVVNIGESDPLCIAIGDTASAGFAGMIFISIGILTMIASIVISILGIRGMVIPFLEYSPFVGGAFTCVGIVAWSFMMPEPPTGSDPNLGYSAWITIVSIFFSIGAGGYSVYTKHFTSGAPTQDFATGNLQTTSNAYNASAASMQPTNPVRAIPLLNKSNEDLNELVVRESSNGNITLSIVADEELFHVLKSVRTSNQESLKHLATIQKSAIQGFSHSRYNLLIDNQLPFTISSAILFPTAALLFFPQTAIFGLFTFTASLIFCGLAVIAKMRPHTVTIHTSGGPIKTHFFEAQSNGFLMTSTMGSIDGILSDYIQTGILEIPQMVPVLESFIPITAPSLDVQPQITTPAVEESPLPPPSDVEEVTTPAVEESPLPPPSDAEEVTIPVTEAPTPTIDNPPDLDFTPPPSVLPTPLPASPPPSVFPTPPPASPPPSVFPTPPPASPPPSVFPTPPPASPPPPPPPPPIPSLARNDSISTDEKDNLLDALND